MTCECSEGYIGVIGGNTDRKVGGLNRSIFTGRNFGKYRIVDDRKSTKIIKQSKLEASNVGKKRGGILY